MVWFGTPSPPPTQLPGILHSGSYHDVRVRGRVGGITGSSVDFFTVCPEFGQSGWMGSGGRGRGLKWWTSDNMVDLFSVLVSLVFLCLCSAPVRWLEARGGHLIHPVSRGHLHSSHKVCAIWGSLLDRRLQRQGREWSTAGMRGEGCRRSEGQCETALEENSGVLVTRHAC